MSTAVLAANLLAAWACSTAGPAARAAHGPTVFVIGVWVQPIELMSVWKARGINTLAEVPQGHDVASWVRAADKLGLHQIRKPSKDLAADAKDGCLLAWATDDEPSNKRGLWLDYGRVAQDPAAVAKQADPWRAAAKASGKFVPIWTNHVGPHIYPDRSRRSALMRDYMQGPESEWLSSDSYPIQGRRPFVIRSNDGYTSTVQGIALDRQRAWSGGKPVMTILGVSAFNEGVPTPTVGQFNAMAWSSVIHGASGIIYFPVHMPPAWSFDATPPALVSALTLFDRQIASMSDILMDRKSGGRTPFKLFRSANAGAHPLAGQLPYPFEAAEIATGQGPFRIVLNLSDKAQVFDRPEWGLSHARFPAYGVRMTAARPSSSAPAPRSRPTS